MKAEMWEVRKSRAISQQVMVDINR